MTDNTPSDQTVSIGVPNDPQRAEQRHQGEMTPEQTKAIAIQTAQLLADRHCEDILVFDLRGLSDLTDFIIIASGTSDRQIVAVADEINVFVKQHGFQRFGNEADGRTTWLVADYVDIVLHLFEPVTRAHYDLEMLWADAPKVDWAH